MTTTTTATTVNSEAYAVLKSLAASDPRGLAGLEAALERATGLSPDIVDKIKAFAQTDLAHDIITELGARGCWLSRVFSCFT